MRAPGRTPEVITTRTATRAALAGVAALVLTTSAAADPSLPQPAPAASTAPPAATIGFLLADRALRVSGPPVARRSAARRPPPLRAAAVHVARRPAVRRTAPRHAVQRVIRPVARVQHHARHVISRTVHRAARRVVHVRRAVHRVAHRVVHRVVRRVAHRAALSARSVVAYALAQRGDPYVSNAAGPNSWDCSGLTMRAFARAGIRLPHRAAQQSTRGRAVSRTAARAGDLVLWGGVGSAYHVGVYLGGGWVLHSPRPGKTVRVARTWGSPQFRRLL